MWKRIPTALGLSLALALPVHAQTPLDDIARIEVLDGGMTARGTYMTALRLTLKPGWKTYWRAPGDGGIPPQFDWSASRNIAGMSMTWPAPKVFESYGLRSIGYHDQLVLPIEITPETAGRPVRLSGQLRFGICKDVCVPTDMSVSHDLDAAARRNPAIVAAMAQRPYSAKEAGVSRASCQLLPNDDGMRFEARIDMPTAGDSEYAVIEPGVSDIWSSRTETRREGGTLVVSAELYDDTSGQFTLDRSLIRITVLGSDHAVDIQGCSPA